MEVRLRAHLVQLGHQALECDAEERVRIDAKAEMLVKLWESWVYKPGSGSEDSGDADDE